MAQRLVITVFDATLDKLPEMMAFISTTLARRPLSAEQLYRIELVCEEALVNIILHGYGQKTGTIEIAVEEKDDKIEVMLKDRGVFFNPADAPIDTSSLNKPLEEREVGGLGIFLMRRLTNEMRYERVGDENKLTLLFIIP